MNLMIRRIMQCQPTGTRSCSFMAVGGRMYIRMAYCSRSHTATGWRLPDWGSVSMIATNDQSTFTQSYSDSSRGSKTDSESLRPIRYRP